MKLGWPTFVIIGGYLTACTPVLKLDTPQEGITINMNVVVDHKIQVSMDEKSRAIIQTTEQTEQKTK